jgi:hypothetical protein
VRFVDVMCARPPNYEAIVKVFPGAAQPGVIFAYGGRIYAPGRTRLAPELQAHEQVHLDRQGNAPERWWDKYLSDKQFMLEEEILGHRAEYRAICQRHPARRTIAAHEIAAKLAAPLYGGVISVADAVREVTL